MILFVVPQPITLNARAKSRAASSAAKLSSSLFLFAFTDSACFRTYLASMTSKSSGRLSSSLIGAI